MTALVEAACGTAAEHVFAAVAKARPSTLPQHVSGGDDRLLAAADPATLRPPTAGLPRVHLVPAFPPARPRAATAPLSGPPPTLAERVRVLRTDDRSLVAEQPDEDRGAAPTGDPSVVVRRLAAAGVEVIAGRRPAGQLARWLAPGVLDALRTRATLTRHGRVRLARAPLVRNVRVYPVHEYAVEATAVVDDGRRVRAIALRLEAHRGEWRATALEIG